MAADVTRIALEASIERLIQSGRFETRDEVLLAGVQLIEQEEAQWADLDAVLTARADDTNIDDFEEADVLFSRLRSKHTATIPAK